MEKSDKGLLTRDGKQPDLIWLLRKIGSRAKGISSELAGIRAQLSAIREHLEDEAQANREPDNEP